MSDVDLLNSLIWWADFLAAAESVAGAGPAIIGLMVQQEKYTSHCPASRGSGYPPIPSSVDCRGPPPCDKYEVPGPSGLAKIPPLATDTYLTTDTFLTTHSTHSA
jgi:hypothetical protein